MAFTFSNNAITRAGQVAAIKEQIREQVGSGSENFIDLNSSSILWQDPDTDEWNVNHYRIDDEGVVELDAMPSMTFVSERM